MFSVLLTTAFSAEPNYDYCIFSAAESECTQYAANAGAQKVQWSAISSTAAIGTDTFVVYFTSELGAVTIDTAEYAFFKAVLVKNSVLNPTPANFLGGKVTLKIDDPSGIKSVTMADSEKFSLKACTLTISNTGSKINLALFDTTDASTITVKTAISVILTVPEPNAVVDYSTIFGYFTLEDVTSVAKLSFSQAPTDISITQSTSVVITVNSQQLTFPLKDGKHYEISNEIAALQLTINEAFQTTISLAAASTLVITIEGTLPASANTKPIQINTASITAPITIPLPLGLADLSNQKFVTEGNSKFVFVSKKAVCYYHTGAESTATSNCPGYQLKVDTLLKSWSFAGLENVKFVQAHYNVEMVDFVLSDASAELNFEDGLILDSPSAAYDQATKDVTLPPGVSFGALDFDVTLKSLKTGITGIVQASGVGKIIAEVTITNAGSDAIADSLKIFSPDSQVTLEFTDANTLTLSGPQRTDFANINSKEIKFSEHKFIMSSAVDLTAFELKWTGQAPTTLFQLSTKYATSFHLLSEHSSQDTIVTVAFTDAPQRPPSGNVLFTSVDPYLQGKSPFVDSDTSLTKVTFVYSRPLCIHTSTTACDPSGILDTDIINKQILTGATSIKFSGACSVDIDYLPFELDFDKDELYIFTTAADKLLLKNDALTEHTKLTLNSHVEIASAMKSATIIAPPASLANTKLGDLTVQHLTLKVDSETSYPFLSKISSGCVITISPKDARDTLEFSDGVTDPSLIQVSDGVATFEAPTGLKFVFGEEQHTELVITKDTQLTIESGVFSAPISAKTKIYLTGATFETGTNYLTLTGVELQTPMFVLCDTVPESSSPSLLSGATFTYVKGDNAYCIYPDAEAPAGCGNLESAQNGQGLLLNHATYVLVIGKCQCDLNVFASDSDNLEFDSTVYHFTDNSDITISANTEPVTLSGLTLIENVKVGVAITTDLFNCPISCVPTAAILSTNEASIHFPPSKSLASPTDLGKIAAKSVSVTINLVVDNSAQETYALSLSYDTATKAYTLCNHPFTELASAPHIKSNPSPQSFSFDITGADAATENELLATVTISQETKVSLGTGFNKVQGEKIIKAVFNPSFTDPFRVPVQPEFSSNNKPFTNTNIQYNQVIPKLCIFVEPVEANLLASNKCDGIEGFIPSSSTANNLGFLLNNADQIMIAEPMTIPASVFADGSQEITIDSRFSKKVETDEFKVEFDETNYDSVDASYKGVLLICGTNPAAQTLAVYKALIDELKCYPTSISSFNTKSTSLYLYVDPLDKEKYDVLGEGKVEETTSLAFLVTGDTTRASITFKPSKTDPLAEVCDSSYVWPAGLERTILAKQAKTPKFTYVEVDFHATEDMAALPKSSVGLEVQPEATIRIMDGFKSQADNPFEFPPAPGGQKLLLTVEYPESFENKFVVGDSLEVTAKTWSPTKPAEPTPKPSGLAGWAIAVIVIVVVIVVAVVVVLVLNFTGVIHLCGNSDDAPSV